MASTGELISDLAQASILMLDNMERSERIEAGDLERQIGRRHIEVDACCAPDWAVSG